MGRQDDVSRAVSHEPWLRELELDEQGWAPVYSLASALPGPPEFIRSERL